MINPNLEMLRTDVENLDALDDEFILVGGCTNRLFINGESSRI